MKLKTVNDLKLIRDLCIIEEMKYLIAAQEATNTNRYKNHGKIIKYENNAQSFDELKAFILNKGVDLSDFNQLKREFADDNTILKFLSKIERRNSLYLCHNAYKTSKRIIENNDFPENYDKKIQERFCNWNIRSASSLVSKTSSELERVQQDIKSTCVYKGAAVALALLTVASAAKLSTYDPTKISDTSISEEQDDSYYQNLINQLQYSLSPNDSSDKNAVSLSFIKNLWCDLDQGKYTGSDIKIIFDYKNSEGSLDTVVIDKYTNEIIEECGNVELFSSDEHKDTALHQLKESGVLPEFYEYYTTDNDKKDPTKLIEKITKLVKSHPELNNKDSLNDPNVQNIDYIP